MFASDENAPGSTFANICDEVGTVISSKEMIIQPDHVSMNNRIMVVTDHRNIYMNIFNSMNRKVDKPTYHSNLYKCSNDTERMFDIHDTSMNPSKPKSTYELKDEEIYPKITATVVTHDLIIVAKENNEVEFFTYPNISRLNKVLLQVNNPKMIEVNCDCTKLCFIDEDELLYIYNVERRAVDSKVTIVPCFPQLQDSVWAMKWSSDHPSKCVVHMKGKIQEVCFHNEEVVKHEFRAPSNMLYLMHYSNLEMRLVNLDEVVNNPLSMPLDNIITIPTKELQDAEAALGKEFQDGDLTSKLQSYNYDKDVLKVIGKKLLERGAFSNALQAFVQSDDYLSVSFAERISTLPQDSLLQEATIMNFNGKLRLAEAKYLEINRSDLAIRMYIDSNDFDNARRLLDKEGVEHIDALREFNLLLAEYLFSQKNYADAFKVGSILMYSCSVINKTKLKLSILNQPHVLKT